MLEFKDLKVGVKTENIQCPHLPIRTIIEIGEKRITYTKSPNNKMSSTESLDLLTFRHNFCNGHYHILKNIKDSYEIF